MEQLPQFVVAGTGHDILVSIGADIPLLQAGEQPVQLPVKILPVPLPQRQAHAKAQDAVHLCLDAHLQNTGDILFRVVEERQDRGKPDHCGDPRVPQLF